MRDRVQLFGGELRLDSQHAEGTQLRVRLPFDPQDMLA
jgi:signal transduction histidine kinase